MVKGSWIARIGRNFDDYPGFHPFRSWANTYAQDCSRPLGIHKETAQGVKAQKNAFSMSKLPEVAFLEMPKVLLTFGSPENAQNF